MMKDKIHLRAPGNWINDPNGFIYYNGEYHLFYQHFPYAARWGQMHWGHAVSKDLIHWDHLKIALFPTKEYDRDGVFSGSALEKDGKLYLYYSGIRYLENETGERPCASQRAFETSQALVVSEDGQTFDNYSAKSQVIPVIRDERIADWKDTRDPKVWRQGEDYYMVLGSTWKEEEGRAVFFRSQDGINWEYANECRSREFGRILECPDLFRVGDRYVLLGSPMRITEPDIKYQDHAKCGLADWKLPECRLTLEGPFDYVDYGLDLYAPQTTEDEAGRRVMIGWMRMPGPVAGSADGRSPWIGMMSLPRVVEVEGDHIFFRVHPNVNACFSVETSREKAASDRIPFRVKTVLSEGESLDICGYRLWMKEGRVWADRSRVFAEHQNYRLRGRTPQVEGHQVNLDIFVDHNLIETFINEGEYVISHIVYDLNQKIEGRIDKILTAQEV